MAKARKHTVRVRAFVFVRPRPIAREKLLERFPGHRATTKAMNVSDMLFRVPR